MADRWGEPTIEEIEDQVEKYEQGLITFEDLVRFRKYKTWWSGESEGLYRFKLDNYLFKIDPNWSKIC